VVWVESVAEAAAELEDVSVVELEDVSVVEPEGAPEDAPEEEIKY
jgi:hypothetical protein